MTCLQSPKKGREPRRSRTRTSLRSRRVSTRTSCPDQLIELEEEQYAPAAQTAGVYSFCSPDEVGGRREVRWMRRRSRCPIELVTRRPFSRGRKVTCCAALALRHE